MKKSLLKLLSSAFFIISVSIFNAQEVPYQIANNYFVNNTYPDKEIHVLKITSEQKFNEVFGMAATMGDEGKPTGIDFSNQFIIAIIDSENQVTDKIYIKDLRIERKKLNLRYGILKRAQPASASFRFAKILIINKDFKKAKLIGDYSRSNNEIPGDEQGFEDLQCHPSISFTWSILEKKCVKPMSTKYTFIGANFNTNGNAGLDFSRDRSKAEIMDSTFPKNLILTKDGDKDIWIEGNYKLEQLKKDVFILKENDKELAIGKLRN